MRPIHDPSIAIHTSHLLSAIRWLLSKQNRDGSWGESLKEKVRWTANAVSSLTVLGFGAGRVKQLDRAVRWLKGIPTDYDEWYLRIQPLIAVGLQSWLDEHNDFERAKELIRQDAVGPLAIKVALAIELLEAGIHLPNLGLIEQQILATLREEGQGLLSFGASSNDTTLYCHFLKIVTNDKHSNVIYKCTRWVCIRAVEKSQGEAVCWEESYGKTAYVTLNLMCFTEVDGVDSLILKALNFFKPVESGAIPPDTNPAHESRSSIYTTILFIRVMGSFLDCNPTYYQPAFIYLLTEPRTLEAKSYKWLKATLLILAIGLIFGLGFILLLYGFGNEFFYGVLASLVAAVCAALFTLLIKAYNFLMGSKK